MGGVSKKLKLGCGVDSCTLVCDQLLQMIQKRGTRIHSTAKLWSFGTPYRKRGFVRCICSSALRRAEHTHALPKTARDSSRRTNCSVLWCIVCCSVCRSVCFLNDTHLYMNVCTLHISHMRQARPTHTHRTALHRTATHLPFWQVLMPDKSDTPATHCNTLQHTATHCNTLQHTATHCNALQHTATHCNTLQRTATLVFLRYKCNDSGLPLCSVCVRGCGFQS